MLLVPHTVVAVAIATVVKQPELALPLALLSHFVLDFIPHWDPLSLVKALEAKEPTRVGRDVFLFIGVDFFIALVLGLFFVWRALGSQTSSPETASAATIFFAAFLANVPDGLVLPLLFERKWGWVLTWRRFHRSLHTIRLPFIWGILTQIAVVAISLLMALR